MKSPPAGSVTNDPSVPLQQKSVEISFTLPPETPKGESGSADAVGGCHSRIPSGLAAARTNVITITAASPSRLDRVLFIVGSSPKSAHFGREKWPERTSHSVAEETSSVNGSKVGNAGTKESRERLCHEQQLRFNCRCFFSRHRLPFLT